MSMEKKMMIFWICALVLSSSMVEEAEAIKLKGISYQDLGKTLKEACQRTKTCGVPRVQNTQNVDGCNRNLRCLLS
ncbi:hypothetical protein V6N13_088442 [Hibiscus sabdariffa]|uniref:Uncharacterized protein n=1 Tax=Hibiscus sabdariffa TaxID=183260 RepID=A0ABR2FZH2_9ROSI